MDDFANMDFMTLMNSWQFRADVYFAKVLWSLGCLPFFVCSIPPFGMLLVHTKPTGYNENGKCVGIKPPITKKQQAIEDERQAKEQGAEGTPGEKRIMVNDTK